MSSSDPRGVLWEKGMKLITNYFGIINFNHGRKFFKPIAKLPQKPIHITAQQAMIGDPLCGDY